MYHEQRHILGGEDRLTNSYPEAIHMGNKAEQTRLPPLVTNIEPLIHPDPILASPLSPLTPNTLHTAPAIVIESQRLAGVDPEASASPQAIQGKDEVDSEFHSKVSEAPATSESSKRSGRFMDFLRLIKS
ncbi:hypothetical protein M433DRAFT_9192 [Acidomyces richmondensis BFW]|nr:hypothetical protein M433DRAFT_9192 [Acidomyces richmondensis BFW]